jgi:hypothetical protein
LIEVSHAPIGSDLSVDVSALLLVEVDLGLERLDLLGLQLEQLLELLLLLHHVLLHLVVLVHEDRLVRGVQLAVKVQLLLAQLPNQVQKISIVLDGLCEVSLCLLKITISLLDHMDALLLGLVEFVLQVKHQSTWSAHLQVVQVNKITETKHLSLVVFFFSLIFNLEVVFNDLFLRIVIFLVVIVRLIQIYTILI